ncbi:flagellar biosynthesis repressor FlbT [Enterovirga rhinocerotis]|uniref:Flagellar protein FlbT n=1 Tax=Enterovirga rhinocerotis TaxID=1339210 RepID=A0A4R7C3S1_9HYPH|nr:flagellar biosynthesis repressor FlbT [Enterovirga rhinocerotis]TDR93150.1 flagellar protein FlbT [Enterovirga rhinocerotis]
MALKVELKPNERIIIGTAVITNGDARIRFYIEGDAPILREKDILTPATADTPAKNIYLALQLMYLNPDVVGHQDLYFKMVTDFLGAAPSALSLVNDVNELVLEGEYYKALRAARALVAYEGELLSHAERGSELRAYGPDHAVAKRA